MGIAYAEIRKHLHKNITKRGSAMSIQSSRYDEMGHNRWPWHINNYNWRVPPWVLIVSPEKNREQRKVKACLEWLCEKDRKSLAEGAAVRDCSPDKGLSVDAARVFEVLTVIRKARFRGVSAVRKELKQIDPISIRKAFFTCLCSKG